MSTTTKLMDDSEYNELIQRPDVGQSAHLAVSPVRVTPRLGGPGSYRLATFCLAALCGVLLISIIAVSACYKSKALAGAKCTSEVQKLQQEKDQLQQEKDQLQMEKDQLQKEKDQLLQDKDQLQMEKDQLQKEKDQLLQDKDQLQKEKDQLQMEKDQLQKEKDQLQMEKDQLQMEKDQLQKEKDQLQKEKDQLQKEKDQLQKEKDQLQMEKDQLQMEKDQLQKEKDQLQKEKDQMQQDKDQLQKEKDQLQKEKDQMQKDKDQLQKEKDQLQKEKDQLQKEKDQLQKEKDQLQAKLAARDSTKAPDGITPTMSATAPPIVCPVDWRLFNSSCYFISRFMSKWPESKSDCESKGGHLAIVNTAEEQTFLWNLLPRGHWNGFWIGVTDENRAGQWKWVDGTPLVGGFWDVAQPTKLDGERCVLIVKTNRLEKVAVQSWNDERCNMSWRYICEKEMGGGGGSVAMPH